MAKMMTIAAKKLGALAMPTFCPRCFWIRMHLEDEPPFSVFPRIFGDIDNYTKRVVHGHFDRTGKPPKFLKALGELKRYIAPPKSRVFLMPIGPNIVLRGEADGIYEKQAG